MFTDNFPTHVRGIFATPAVADLDGDGAAEIVVSSWDHYLYVLNHNGSVRAKVFLKDTSWASPAIADVDRDGVLEIVAAWDCDANSSRFDCAYGNPGGFVGVFSRDLTLRWKQFLPGQVPWSSPALGDVRGDGRLAVVLATGQMPCMMYTGAAGPCGTGSAIDTRSGGRRIYGFDAATGAPLPGWPAPLPEKTMSSPALADVDGDGRLEAFVGTGGRLYRIDSTGAVRWGADACVALQKNPCGYSPLPKVDASPVVGDLLGTGRVVVAIAYDFKVSFVDAVTGAIVTTVEPSRAAGEISQTLGNGLTATTWGGRSRLYGVTMLCRSSCYAAGQVWDASTLAVDAGPAGRLLWPTFRGDAARRGVLPQDVTPTGAIGAYWTANGGAGGPLGEPQSAERAVPGGRAQSFARGQVFWSSGTGAHAVVGAVLGRYLAGGGPEAYGLPTTDEGYGGVAGARSSTFQRARIWWSPSTGAQAVQGAVLERYLATGAAGGPLGLPTTDERDGEVAGSRLSVFQYGRVYWSAGTGAHEMYGAILARYLAVGGPVRFGLPTAGEVDRDGARAVSTQRGRLYWTARAGAASLQGAVLEHYDATGGAGRYGLPLGDELVDGRTGTPYSVLGRGEIHWSPATGAHAVIGSVLGRWRSLGGPASPLGLPTSDERDSAAAGGRVSLFARGEVHWSSATGAWEVLGAIRERWLAAGGAGSALGLPVSGEYDVPGGRRSDFAHGSISWTAATGVTAVRPG